MRVGTPDRDQKLRSTLADEGAKIGGEFVQVFVADVHHSTGFVMMLFDAVVGWDAGSQRVEHGIQEASDFTRWIRAVGSKGPNRSQFPLDRFCQLAGDQALNVCNRVVTPTGIEPVFQP
jgi:hypothetical protein